MILLYGSWVLNNVLVPEPTPCSTQTRPDPSRRSPPRARFSLAHVRAVFPPPPSPARRCGAPPPIPVPCVAGRAIPWRPCRPASCSVCSHRGPSLVRPLSPAPVTVAPRSVAASAVAIDSRPESSDPMYLMRGTNPSACLMLCRRFLVDVWICHSSRLRSSPRADAAN